VCIWRATSESSDRCQYITMTDISRKTPSGEHRKTRGEYIKRAFLKAPLPADMSVVPIGATDEHYQCHMKAGDTLADMRDRIITCTACDKPCNVAYYYSKKYDRCIPCTLAALRGKTQAEKKDDHHSDAIDDNDNVDDIKDAINALTEAISVLALHKERLTQRIQ
jgi:hypothetical protein